MSDSAISFVLVKKGNPIHYNDKREAVTAYLTAVGDSPNAYRHEVHPSKITDADVIDMFVDKITNDEKLDFYAFDNNTAPTAIALYQTGREFNKGIWYNKAAKENLKNYHIIDNIEYNMRMRGGIGEGSKVLMLGDFIHTDDGRKGRINAVTDKHIAIKFDAKPNHEIFVSEDATFLSMVGASLDLYQKPTGDQLHFEGSKMGTYWTKGDASFGQGNKRIDIYAQANVWHISDLTPLN